MNRSVSRLALLAIVALSASAAMAQTYSSSGALAPKAPKNYVSPEERIKEAPTTARPNFVPTVGTIAPQTQPQMRTLQPGEKVIGQVTGAGPLCTKKGCVPVIGRTADQKYPVYGLQGDLQDLTYMAPTINAVYQPQDLLKRMGYVETSDLKGHGIQCEFICKNAAGQVIGLNPEVKWMETGKPPVQQAKGK